MTIEFHYGDGAVQSIDAPWYASYATERAYRMYRACWRAFERGDIPLSEMPVRCVVTGEEGVFCEFTN